MTGQELKSMFELKVGNRNLLDTDFLMILNEGLKGLSILGRNFNTFREKYLLTSSNVDIHYNGEGVPYIELSDLPSNILNIEAEKSRDGDKCYLDMSIYHIIDDKVLVVYEKILDDKTSLTEEIGLSNYNYTLLNFIISTYYEMRTDSIDLSQYYKQKVLSDLSI